jgi:hypothetical protein
MITLRRFALAAVGILLALTGCHAPRSRVPGVTVLPGRNEPQIAVEIYPDRAVLDIESPRGIGSATVELSEKFRPKHLTMRLHLRGLEEFRFSCENRTAIISVASTGRHEVRGRALQDGVERSVSPRDRLWMPVRFSTGETAEIPLRDGWIEVDAPADFLKSGARRFTIEWVDFFR